MVGQSYSSWPLGRQLKLSYLLISILVSLSIILITRYQLQWIYNQLISSYSSLLTSSILSHMKSLGREEAEFATQEFKNFIKNTEQLHDIDSMVLGFGPILSPIISSEPVQDLVYNASALDYTTGCFFAPGNLSEKGLELEKREAGMDKLYPLFDLNLYLDIYTGFELDEIIHYYPGSLTLDRTYTPLVREWYYTAKDLSPLTIITEPYQDSNTNDWVVTIAKAILDNNGNFFGVAAGDVTLKDITSRTNTVKILQNGFIMLVTHGGMVLTIPDTWDLPVADTILIYEENYTGFSLNLWLNVLNSSSESLFELSRNGTDYIFLNYNIRPFSNSNQTTHYLFIFADINEVLQPIQHLIDLNSSTSNVLFIVTLCVVSLVFFVLFFLFHFFIRKFTKKLENIKKLLGKIAHRGLFINVTKNINFNSIENEKDGIENLVEAIKGKILNVRETEESFSYYEWGNTRPEDLFYYSKWLKKLYPFNLFNEGQMKWRKTFPELINIKNK